MCAAFHMFVVWFSAHLTFAFRTTEFSEDCRAVNNQGMQGVRFRYLIVGAEGEQTGTRETMRGDFM